MDGDSPSPHRSFVLQSWHPTLLPGPTALTGHSPPGSGSASHGMPNGSLPALGGISEALTSSGVGWLELSWSLVALSDPFIWPNSRWFGVTINSKGRAMFKEFGLSGKFHAQYVLYHLQP